MVRRAPYFIAGVLAASSLTAGCGPTPAPPPPTPAGSSAPAAGSTSAAAVQFTDVTDQAGIRFAHFNGTFGKKWMPETTGGGCAFIDFDKDGHEDIVLVDSGQFNTPAAIYK